MIGLSSVQTVYSDGWGAVDEAYVMLECKEKRERENGMSHV